MEALTNFRQRLFCAIGVYLSAMVIIPFINLLILIIERRFFPSLGFSIMDVTHGFTVLAQIAMSKMPFYGLWIEIYMTVPFLVTIPYYLFSIAFPVYSYFKLIKYSLSILLIMTSVLSILELYLYIDMMLAVDCQMYGAMLWLNSLANNISEYCKIYILCNQDVFLYKFPILFFIVSSFVFGKLFVCLFSLPFNLIRLKTE